MGGGGHPGAHKPGSHVPPPHPDIPLPPPGSPQPPPPAPRPSPLSGPAPPRAPARAPAGDRREQCGPMCPGGEPAMQMPRPVGTPPPRRRRRRPAPPPASAACGWGRRAPPREQRRERRPAQSAFVCAPSARRGRERGRPGAGEAAHLCPPHLRLRPHSLDVGGGPWGAPSLPSPRGPGPARPTGPSRVRLPPSLPVSHAPSRPHGAGATSQVCLEPLPFQNL